MEVWTKICWLGLAAVHAAPALSVFHPALLERLYGIRSEGDLRVLLLHRGALFLVIVIAALWAAFDPATRRMASVLVATSVLAFLVLYAAQGESSEALRGVAMVDLAALVPLAVVLIEAWRRHPAALT